MNEFYKLVEAGEAVPAVSIHALFSDTFEDDEGTHTVTAEETLPRVPFLAKYQPGHPDRIPGWTSEHGDVECDAVDFAARMEDITATGDTMLPRDVWFAYRYSIHFPGGPSQWHVGIYGGRSFEEVPIFKLDGSPLMMTVNYPEDWFFPGSPAGTFVFQATTNKAHGRSGDINPENPFDLTGVIINARFFIPSGGLNAAYRHNGTLVQPGVVWNNRAYVANGIPFDAAVPVHNWNLTRRTEVRSNLPGSLYDGGTPNPDPPFFYPSALQLGTGRYDQGSRILTVANATGVTVGMYLVAHGPAEFAFTADAGIADLQVAAVDGLAITMSSCPATFTSDVWKGPEKKGVQITIARDAKLLEFLFFIGDPVSPGDELSWTDGGLPFGTVKTVDATAVTLVAAPKFFESVWQAHSGDMEDDGIGGIEGDVNPNDTMFDYPDDHITYTVS